MDKIHSYSFDLEDSEIELLQYKIPPKIKVNDSNINAIGIDLGTTRCCAAVNRRKGNEIIALDNNGERQLPAYVSFSDEKEKCGQIVVNQMRNSTKLTVFDSKRIIGRKFEEIKTDANWPFQVINVEDKPMIRFLKPNDYMEKSPEEIAAVLLKHIKRKAEEFQGKKLDEVVITIPAAFTKNQKIATHAAAMIAGWKIIHLLPEPVAASIAYYIERPIPNEFTMLLFDCGGGTLDVCIFNVTDNILKVLGQYGDRNLGGRDLDNLLYAHFSSILKEKYNIEVCTKEKWKYILTLRCMEIKHSLSVENEAILDVSEFDQNFEDTVRICRQEFEKIAEKILKRIEDVVIEALSPTEYVSLDINKILLAGGSSRMPMIQHLLRKMFSKAEHCCEENPDEVIAIGAAYFAYSLQETPHLKIKKS